MATRDILSDDELDALLDSVTSGGVALDKPANPREVRSFDFTAREHSMLGQMPALQIIHEKLCFGFTRGLTDLFNIPVQISLESAGVCKLTDVFSKLPLPAGINILKLKPLPGTALFIVPPVLLFFLVDQYFGNTNPEPDQVVARRAIAPTERRINELLVRRFLEVLKQSWAEFLVLDGEHSRFESNPEFVQIADLGELMISVTLTLSFSNWTSDVQLIIPYASLEPVRAKLGSTLTAASAAADQNWSASLKRELMNVPVDLCGVYATAQLSLRRLMSLQVDDVIPIDSGSFAELLVDEVPLFYGEYGASQGKKSIKIFGRSAGRDG